MKGAEQMTRKLKALGLALVAVFAMSAFSAAAAQAEKGAVLTAEKYPAKFDGTQTTPVIMNRGGRQTTCAGATVTTEIKSPATTGSAAPVFENCHTTILGTKMPITVTMNGCELVLHATADFAGGAHKYTAIADLVCPEGKLMETHVYANSTKHLENVSICTYKTPPQSGFKGVEVTNKPAAEGTKDHIEVHINISGITTLRTSGSALTCGAEHDSNTSLTGSILVQGTTEAGEPNGLTVSTE
jgi:hypothetical protein